MGENCDALIVESPLYEMFVADYYLLKVSRTTIGDISRKPPLFCNDENQDLEILHSLLRAKIKS
jgi:hypothetical protein